MVLKHNDIPGSELPNTDSENNFQSHLDDIHNNFPLSSEALDDRFNEKKLAKFLLEMEKIRASVDPRFLASFDTYNKEVTSLLSDNLSVVASAVVQKELTSQNTRIQTIFNKNSIDLNDTYSKIFS